MRIDKNEAPIHYTPTAFEGDSYKGCEITIRRMETFGMITLPEPGPLVGNLFVDVLDEGEDILETYPVTRKGFEYMRRVLRFRKEPSE